MTRKKQARAWEVFDARIYEVVEVMKVSSDDSSTIINADDETPSSEMSTNVLGRSALTSLVRLPTLLFAKGRAILQPRRHRTGSFVVTYIYLPNTLLL